MDIRPATPTDLPEIQAIYAHHVLHGTGTFEEVPPSVEEMAARFAAGTARGWCWLVAADATGVLGFAFYAQHKDRSAYRFTAEDSVYVREDVRGQGVGKALVARLIEHATERGLPPDGGGDRRCRECRLDRRACQPGLHPCRRAARRRAEIRPLAGRGDDAAPARAGDADVPDGADRPAAPRAVTPPPGSARPGTRPAPGPRATAPAAGPAPRRRGGRTPPRRGRGPGTGGAAPRPARRAGRSRRSRDVAAWPAATGRRQPAGAPSPRSAAHRPARRRMRGRTRTGMRASTKIGMGTT